MFLWVKVKYYLTWKNMTTVYHWKKYKEKRAERPTNCRYSAFTYYCCTSYYEVLLRCFSIRVLLCSYLLLKQVGCGQFYDEINKKLFSLVIPSYIQVNETDNASDLWIIRGRPMCRPFFLSTFLKRLCKVRLMRCVCYCFIREFYICGQGWIRVQDFI